MKTPGTNPTPPPGGDDYQTLDEYLSKATTALINAALPDVLPLLAKRGYPKAVLEAKLAEVQQISDLDENQKKEFGDQLKATQAYKNTKKALKKNYSDHVKLARYPFEGDVAAQKALGLKGERARTDSGFLAEALLFYNNALAEPKYITALATKGILEQDLLDAKTGLGNLPQLEAAQIKETGEAQQATADRNTPFVAFEKWMNEFYVTAEIALRSTPQLMEKLGIVQK